MDRPTHQGQIVELQSIRGLAALVVLFVHTLHYWTTQGSFQNFAGFFNGNGPVITFFVLSGYVLTLSLISKSQSIETTAVFYLRRLFRIYPAVWAISTISLVYLLTLHYRYPILGQPDSFARIFAKSKFNPLHIFASYGAVVGFLVPPVWTISVELAGSLFIPLFTILVSKSKPIFCALLAILLGIALTIGIHTPHRIGLFLVDFAFGATIFILPDRLMQAWKRSGAWRYIVLIVATLTLVAFRQISGIDYHRNGPSSLVEGIAAFVIVASIARSEVNVTFLRHSSLVWLGDISYSFYLVHFIVMCVIGNLMGMWFQAAVLQHPVLASCALAALTLACSLPLADVLYRFVEKPGIGVGKRVVQTWNQVYWTKQASKRITENQPILRTPGE
jgi:peptidoglycan/LPS O-acetylase OafA/YrhL